MVRCEQVTRTFHARGRKVEALVGVDLNVAAGEFVVVRGPSGCGKTSLLLAIGGMFRPTSGRVIVAGNDVYALGKSERAAFRAANIGFVFQMFHLVPYLNVEDNVALAATSGDKEARTRAAGLLDQLGMSERARHTPGELSAGERQRTAIARALLNRPKLILADEPTGNLDPDNAREVFRELASFHRDGGTVIVVTHGDQAEEYADRVIELRQGRIVSATEGVAS